MDIADRRLPQDGRYSIDAHGRSIEARVASMPTIIGEKLIIRLLDHQTQIPQLDTLECLPSTQNVFVAFSGSARLCHRVRTDWQRQDNDPLYASLAERNLQTQNLCSVEDPVEIRISGVAQVQVNPRAGFDICFCPAFVFAARSERYHGRRDARH